MRFLHHEHAAITNALQAHDVDVRAVLFVKRRGRLHVQVPGRSDTFIFFRRKSTGIGEEHEWQHRTDYFLGEAKERNAACTWTQVMKAFNAWLEKP